VQSKISPENTALVGSWRVMNTEGNTIILPELVIPDEEIVTPFTTSHDPVISKVHVLLEV
jgi:hypothetical protein